MKNKQQVHLSLGSFGALWEMLGVPGEEVHAGDVLLRGITDVGRGHTQAKKGKGEEGPERKQKQTKNILLDIWGGGFCHQFGYLIACYTESLQEPLSLPNPD